MEIFVSELFIAGAVGGVVVKQVHILQQLSVLRHHEGVGKVGVAARGGGWGGKLTVWNHLPVGGGEIQSALDAWDGVVRDAMLPDTFALDVAVAGLLLKQEPIAWHAVVERERGDFHVVVLENLGWLLAADGVDADVEIPVLHEEVDLRLQHRLQVRRHVEVEVVAAVVERERREQSHQSEAVIAVGVADEDVVELPGVDLVSDQLHLRAFPAVDHIGDPLQADNLRGGVMPQCRFRAPAAEYGDFEQSATLFLFIHKPQYIAIFRQKYKKYCPTVSNDLRPSDNCDKQGVFAV